MFTLCVKDGLNRVEVRDLGLILWENEATPLISIFRPVLDLNIPKHMQKNIKQFQSMPELPCTAACCIKTAVRGIV